MDDLKYDMIKMKTIQYVEEVIAKYNFPLKVKVGEIYKHNRGVERFRLQIYCYSDDFVNKLYRFNGNLEVSILSSGVKYRSCKSSNDYVPLTEHLVLDCIKRDLLDCNYYESDRIGKENISIREQYQEVLYVELEGRLKVFDNDLLTQLDTINDKITRIRDYIKSTGKYAIINKIDSIMPKVKEDYDNDMLLLQKEKERRKEDRRLSVERKKNLYDFNKIIEGDD